MGISPDERWRNIAAAAGVAASLESRWAQRRWAQRCALAAATRATSVSGLEMTGECQNAALADAESSLVLFGGCGFVVLASVSTY